jgi:hypothetical protein
MAVVVALVRPAVAMPAVGFGDIVVDLAVGGVLFVVVVSVTVVLMSILQAVLPHGDTEADAIAAAEAADDETADAVVDGDAAAVDVVAGDPDAG